ncbi:unnamed protein product [Tetraodon nigroviridis]|uniref:Poly [ADP-ribose] polymerase n=1 Tax=Tetraodon nigroviridis TaxID=99883 RepID=Q4RTR8_TETNG|nr:unnamed protein product [Tetraodon nigroviridis]
MGVFTNCSVLVELKTLPIKEKRSLKAAITENGGTICFVVNKQCSLILTSDASSLSPNRLRSIRKHQTPVVGVEYVSSCLERGALLPLDGYRLDAPPTPAPPTKSNRCGNPPLCPNLAKLEPDFWDLLLCRVYGEDDSDLPPFPDRFQVAKYSIYEKEAAVKEALVFPSTSEEALEVYECLRTSLLQSGLRQRRSLPAQARELGSAPLQQLLLEERLNTGTLTQEVGAFVELLWTEATGRLGDILTAPVEKLSLNDVSVAPRLQTDFLRSPDPGSACVCVCVCACLCVRRQRSRRRVPARRRALILLCVQLIRDLLNVSEMTLRSSAPSCLGKYRALRCSLEAVPPNSSEFLDVAAQLQHSRVQIQQVLRVCRGVELQTFEADVGGIKPLLHSSRPSNFVGLLSRGLLMPRVGVEHHGIERTDAGNLGSGIYFSDAFSTSLKYSHPGATDGSRLLLVCDVALGRCQDVRKRDRTLSQAPDGYHSVHGVRSAPGAPSEFEVGVWARARSGLTHRWGHMSPLLQDDEYVVYSPGQVRLKYVVRFSMEGDQLKEFSPSVSTSAQPLPPPAVQELQSEEAEVVKNPVEDVKAGLLDSSGQQVPLQAVHVRCKLMDLLSQVGTRRSLSSALLIVGFVSRDGRVSSLSGHHFSKIHQPEARTHRGQVCVSPERLSSRLRIRGLHQREARGGTGAPGSRPSLLPLSHKQLSDVHVWTAGEGEGDGSQGVQAGGGERPRSLPDGPGRSRASGFQAEIPPSSSSSAHSSVVVVFGFSLQDVFTISVGNLPPAATVLVKVTFVSELVVQGGSILFSLPGSVAPWQESAALNQTTQASPAPGTDPVLLVFEMTRREFTLDACVEMPHEISRLTCLTHSVKTKRTDCKAVVSVLPGQILGPEGFQLSVSLSKAHLPRMWVEKHPEKDSQVYFDIDAGSPPSNEVVLLLDTSESMRDSLHTLQEIALRVLKALHPDVKVNIILFGTGQFDPGGLAVTSPLSPQRFTPVGGSTELWRPLRALSLLPPSRGLRNLLLLSDGHVQNPELTLQLLRDGVQHSRLFPAASGLHGPTANRHMLRALAQAGGGAFEFFDTKSRHTWAEKVACQVKRMAAPGCSSVSVKWQQFNPTAPPPVQAPKQLHALFRDCHTLVYGFVPHCTQATLLGSLSGKELRTMVSTSELQKTRGTFLHKLTARAVIRDYEDGNLDADAAQHEVKGKKAELREFVISLSKEFSILSQFTSFVAVEERDGYWELTPELGKLLNFDVDLFVNVFLKSKGIDSLGARARADILRLLATLLVLQLMRVAKLEEGRLLRTLFSLVDPSQQRWERSRNRAGRPPAGADASLYHVTPSRSRGGEQVKRAVDWVRWADRQYPCICSRLEFGLSWESSTRQLLGFEDAHRSSPLTQLKLRLRPVPLLVS